ncbi:MAG: ASKHA domain-containing protein [Anaerohalosphaeraceae bacterium]|nr:ASKHA domain-containing protein [Anaerohalosphaeraceae bacterium]
MEQKQYKVVFQPTGRSVFALAGTKIIEAAGAAGIIINTPCGGTGTCGKCRVKIVSPQAEPTDSDKEIFDSAQLAQGWRLACCNPINCDCVIEVPESSRLVGGHKIQVTSENGSKHEVIPSLRKVFFELDSPTMQDNVADVARLQNEIGRCKLTLKQLKLLPGQLRENGFKGTAVLAGHRLLDIESGDTTGKCYGIACDIGTTTLVACLHELCSGSELAVVSRMNPQISFGDDVLSRIRHSDSCDGCLAEMQNAIITEINGMITELCDTASVAVDNIYEIAFAGNTTMEHLLCGIDPSGLGQVPFVPTYSRALILNASDLKISINRFALAYVFPVIGGFVGGDTVAGILATDMLNQTSPAIMIDIGTNGEIVLLKDGKLSAASTAAGPAFEGAGISSGMRAMAGAIEKIKFESDVVCSTIGDCKSVGICGSALIDLAAEMLRTKILSPNGRILPPDELDDNVSDAIKQRLIKGKNNQYDFSITDRISVTQEDIRKLQLAVGAIRAGLNIMLKKAFLKPSDLQKVFIAGGFGSFIRRDNAQRIGLLPGGIDHTKMSYVGNTSLAGARISLLSADARKRGEQIAEQVEHIELSLDLDFQDEFVSAMIFP